MVSNIRAGVLLMLWSEEAAARALSQPSEPEMVAVMVAEFAYQMSKSTTASASEWTNVMLDQEYAAIVAASRAIEYKYAGRNRVVDPINLSPEGYSSERRNGAHRYDYSEDIIFLASSDQKAEDFITESTGKRDAYDFFVRQCRQLGKAPELDDEDPTRRTGRLWASSWENGRLVRGWRPLSIRLKAVAPATVGTPGQISER